MSDQADKVAVLKSNKQQQMMLNELLPVINKAIKDNFVAYAKMIQCDVTSFVDRKAVADGVIGKDYVQFATDINALVIQIGKDLEKQMMNKFAAIQNEMK